MKILSTLTTKIMTVIVVKWNSGNGLRRLNGWQTVETLIKQLLQEQSDCVCTVCSDWSVPILDFCGKITETHSNKRKFATEYPFDCYRVCSADLGETALRGT